MPTANSSTILSVAGLSKSYGDLVAVDNLSLSIVRGEIFGFLGPNGAGKTTTISMICGLLKCDAGEITIDGLSLKNNYRKCKRMMGLCPQNLVIWESLTCLEQLEFMGRQYDIGRRSAREKGRELLEMLGLADRRHKLAKTLSGGMKRRLNIALALVHDPEILILDEPQAGLDPQSRILVREYIRSLTGKITVILTTHEMDEADRLADRIAIIDHGQLLVLDTSEGLKNQIGAGDILEIKIPEGQEEKLERLQQALPANLRNLAYQQETLRLVGGDILDVLPSLLETIRSADIQVQDITLRQKTLEDVFIALTGRRLRE
ncbi:MAG: ABC transporter ATP-binding protein [Fidelibacterota bacterium]|nr:MAG: ABC transporter ATP-binding protein [Candidatus Neomarinimicrobiota bacterium]